MVNNAACLLLVLVTCTVSLHSALGQNYHFSNGWHPGKRSQETNNACQFRPEIKALLIKIIEEEVSRLMLDQSCYGGLAAFKNLLKKDLVYPPLVNDDQK